MIGMLPTSLEVNGKEYEIRSDFRNILQIFVALEDNELTDEEKFYAFLKRLYVDFDKMPKEDYQNAYKEASSFLECHDRSENKKNPRLVNWQKDEQMIFPAINAVAGEEVRLTKYMHWWTFLGYFENIDNECLWSFVLSIRQKKAKGKKLEKYEQEFYNRNREMCSVEHISNKKTLQDELADMFEMLAEGG